MSEVAKAFAAKINGRNYPGRLTKDECLFAKENGLLVAYGASDDLLEFEGVIYDEVGAYDGTKVTVTVKQGKLKLLQDNEEIKDAINLLEREGYKITFDSERTFTVTAEWCPKDFDGSWRISSNVPVDYFDIMEDGERFCRGIVIDTADI